MNEGNDGRPGDGGAEGRPPRCETCGAPLPATDPAAPCPRCLLRLALEGDADLPEEAAAAPSSPTHPSGPDPDLPDHIGPYRVLETIGEGGMGVVYLAEQTRPLRRRVAVKVIKLGMDTRQVIARFEGERQALARMSHPNVARVLDAGATGAGRPYFVMEHVDGVPITDYCDAHQLPLRDRLALFQQACEAIQHAHQKGIIHRDVKPSNVLVTTESGRPAVKVIDFGIAKAVDQQLTEETIFTRQGMLLGTPEFMSPEQAAGDSLAIDTRTDVYALGVLLYLLAVGVLPFELRELRRAALDEIRRLVREVDPPRPSTRLSSLGAASTRAATARRTDPGTLVRELRGDLDWIVMKALDKAPERRYPTPSELAADIERHLRHREVEARPPSTLYRLRKLVRRHRVAVAAAAAVLLAVLAGSAVATWQAVRATRAEVQALQEAETARQVADFVVGLFEVSDPLVAQGREVTARQILDQGRRRIETSLADQPEVRERMLEVLADVHRQLNLFGDARPLADAVLESRRRRLGDEHPQVAAALHRAGVTYRDAGDWATAEEHLARARDLYARLSGERSAAWAAVTHDLAEALRNQGRLDDSRTLQEAGLAVREAVLGTDAPEVADDLATLASLHYEMSDYATAEGYFRRALAVREASLGPNHPAVAQTLDRLGSTVGRQGRYAEEEPLHLRALEIYRRIYGDTHSTVAEGLNNLATLRARQGRLAEAEAGFRQALGVYAAVFGDDHPRVAVACKNLARVLMLEGRYGEAEEMTLRALRLDEEERGPDDPWVGSDLRVLGELQRRQGRTAEAERSVRRALEIYAASVGEEHFESAQAYKVLAEVLVTRGRAAEALAPARRAATLIAAATGERSPATCEALETLGDALLHAGQGAEARRTLELSLEIAGETFGEGHPTTARTYRLLAKWHEMDGQMAEAGRLYRRSAEVAEAAHGPDHLDVADALHGLAGVRAAAGATVEARELYARALAVRRDRLGDAHPDTRATARALAALAAEPREPDAPAHGAAAV